MTTKERLHQIIDKLDEHELERVLLIVEGTIVSDANVDQKPGSNSSATAQVETWDPRYEGPLGELIRFGDSLDLPDDGVTDVSSRHEEYLADIYESEWKR